jgi:hypothetical protein
MALCAPNAVIGVRAQRTAENCPIVWVDRAHAEERIVARKAAAYATPRAVSLPDEPHLRGCFFAAFLYQRPPPFSLR